MRYYCWACNKSVTSELPYDSVIRAVLFCPECIESGKHVRIVETVDELEEIKETKTK